ncbi:hypothetical protein DUNSADRAFT_14129, partial [Dunaliella salina]
FDLPLPFRQHPFASTPPPAPACRTPPHANMGHVVEVIQSDPTQKLHSNLVGHVDLLVFNPPYVPTPDSEVHLQGVASAWAGGHKGRRIIDRLLPQLHGLLSPHGVVYLVTVSENDPAGIVQDMQSQGFQGCVLMSRQADEELLSIVRLQAKCEGLSLGPSYEWRSVWPLSKHEECGPFKEADGRRQ